ncbi:MAG: patatin-like phospholipase family protein [Clostridia bacterium]|nr:patatin-like phospholipase family protein [Clostridia bacterium]
MKTYKKHKLGLALGSGGARGMALLGALKALEEENIEFDVVAGTSIGSVVGALYAKGYTVGDMLRLKDSLGLSDPQNMLLLYLGGTGLVGMMRRVTGGAYFDDLIKPFRAIATDLYTGEEVVMGMGEVATAIAASSAVPPAFRPVERDGRKLVDGAFTNSVPSDAVKNLGAERILGINLGAESDTNQDLKRTLDELYPGNGVKLTVKSTQCYTYSDYVLAPDLRGISGADIRRLDDMYETGYKAARDKMNEIEAALDID